MDPFTMMAIAQGVPSLINLLSSQPQQPGPSPVNNINWQGMVPYQNQMMNNAFNPNSNLLGISLARAGAGVNNNMVSRGLGGSSLADASLRQSNTDITNDWIKNQTQRESGAYGAAMGGLGAQAGVANMQNQDAWNQYLQSVAQKNTNNAGIGSLLGLGGSMASKFMGSSGAAPTNGLYANTTGYTGGSGTNPFVGYNANSGGGNNMPGGNGGYSLAL